jgi:uncharacterized membrane protein
MAYAAVIIAGLAAAGGLPIGRRILAIIAPLMALVSIWLLYLQAFVIHAFCKFCLASAAASLCLAALVLIERLSHTCSIFPVRRSPSLAAVISYGEHS